MIPAPQPTPRTRKSGLSPSSSTNVNDTNTSDTSGHHQQQQGHPATTSHTHPARAHPRVALPDAVGSRVLDHEFDHLYSGFFQAVELLPGGSGYAARPEPARRQEGKNKGSSRQKSWVTSERQRHYVDEYSVCSLEVWHG